LRSATKIKKETPKKQKRAVSDLLKKFSRKKTTPDAPDVTMISARKISATPESVIQEFKITIAQQQQVLNTYLDKVEELEDGGKGQLRQLNNDLQKEISKLHNIIEQKDHELDEMEQRALGAQKMAGKIDEVYQEFEQLQLKMMHLEKQANRANNLVMELEDTKQSYEQVYHELTRKQEKLEELMNENQRMRADMNMLEDKLSEANLQRQQLQKKVQFLQELNADMQCLSDTNKKLQTELRRIGELESMLNMMAQERDFLLKKKNKE
jgi:chromosome segregation ATPase